MNNNGLISLPLNEAENILKNKGIKYNIIFVDTFKLKNPDTQAVIKVSEKDGFLTLFVCGFMCKVEKYE